LLGDDLPPPESIAGPSHGVVGQGPSWSGDFRRVLFGPESPESPESEITPATTTYRFILPPEMAHLANTTSVQTGIPATTLAPINTQRTPAVNPTLPPGLPCIESCVECSASNTPFPGQTIVTTQPPVGTQFPGGNVPLIGGPQLAFRTKHPSGIGSVLDSTYAKCSLNPWGATNYPYSRPTISRGD
jgi:hypothetical protein